MTVYLKMVLLSDYHLIHVTLCEAHVWEDLCFILKLNQYVLVWNEHIVGRDRAKHCRRGQGGATKWLSRELLSHIQGARQHPVNLECEVREPNTDAME